MKAASRRDHNNRSSFQKLSGPAVGQMYSATELQQTELPMMETFYCLRRPTDRLLNFRRLALSTESATATARMSARSSGSSNLATSFFLGELLGGGNSRFFRLVLPVLHSILPSPSGRS
jgi:hypothetical protein